MAPAAPSRETYRVGDLIVDVGLQRVSGPAGDIALPKLSFELLLALVRRAPDFVTNDELSSLVWQDVVVSPETVTKRVNLLREALGDDSARPRYVAGLRSRGYRIVAPVDRGPDHGVPTESGKADPGRRQTGLRISILAAALAVLAALAWLTSPLWRGKPGVATPSAIPQVVASGTTVAVLPFENLSPDPADAYLAVGVPEMVLDRLSTVPQLTVIALGSSFDNADWSSGPRDIGRRLGAQFLVEGSTQREGDRLRVTARLVDARTGTQVWSTHIDDSVSGIFGMQDAIATQVAGELHDRVQGVVRPSKTRGHEPPIDAQLEYLQGRVLLGRNTVRDSESAAAHFAAAMALDAKFAAAIAGLFEARMLAADRRHDDLAVERKRQLPLIERALALDPDCGPAYVARATWGGGDAAGQDADFRRGLELDPSNGRGLVAYSEFLDKQGRRDDASRALDRALRVDPMSPRAHFRQVMQDFDTRGGLVLEPGMKHVLEIDPNYQPALQRYAKYRWTLHGKLAEAAQVIEHAIEVDPDNPWSRQTAAAIYLDLDDETAAREVAAGTASSRGTARILLALHSGDWRSAGEAALSKAGHEYNRYESWGVPEAVRDYGLKGGNTSRAIRFLEEHYGLQAGGTLDISNFRAAVCLAQLLQASGQTVRARQLLAQMPAAIDATIPLHGAVYALRSKASALLLAGDRDAALETLAESFGSEDLTQWWYTLERDPLWLPLHDEPAFKALAAQVRARVAREQAELAEMRNSGKIVARGTMLKEP
jgi:TolB-like protein/DNA-binding winged helix-turn-helix (wHTH) protein/tetratricopeptide (TPR) repeat protein